MSLPEYVTTHRYSQLKFKSESYLLELLYQLLEETPKAEVVWLAALAVHSGCMDRAVSKERSAGQLMETDEPLKQLLSDEFWQSLAQEQLPLVAAVQNSNTQSTRQSSF